MLVSWQANVRSELQDTINMMALLLRQIFAEAEDSVRACVCLTWVVAVVADWIGVLPGRNWRWRWTLAWWRTRRCWSAWSG